MGFYEFVVGALGALDPAFKWPADWVQHLSVGAITISQPKLNHRVPGLTIKLTDFSG